jgi:hypothetical protein
MSCKNNKVENKQTYTKNNREYKDNQSTEKTLKKVKETTSKEICVLNENLNVLGEITSIDFIADDRFVVSTSNPSNILIYNTGGKQLKEIKLRGKGPNEFLNPSIIKIYNNKIYVWCSDQLRMLLYDLKGNPIQEFKGFERAITNFLPFKKYIFFYEAGGFEGSLIKLFDTEDKNFINEFGETTKEHLILNSRQCAGGMTIFKNKLLFSSSDNLKIHSIDLKTLKDSVIYQFQDKEFEVNKFRGNVNNLISKNKDKLIQYLNKNSFIKGLYVYYNTILLITEIGEYEFINNKLDYSNRYNKSYFINIDQNRIKTLRSKLSPNNNNCLYTVHNNHIYSIKIKRSNNDIKYALFRQNINL